MSLERTYETGDWLPLDNAAKIYPSTASLKSPAVFRLAFTLNEPVRLMWLEKALGRIMPRFPCFQVHLRRGFFWYYLQRDSTLPVIQPLKTVHTGYGSRTGKTSPLLRISAGNGTVAADFFHALTDGSGGMAFLLALAAEYFRQAGKLDAVPDGIMDPDDEPSPAELEDSYRKNFPGKALSPKGMKPAWHLQGPSLEPGTVRIIEGRMPVSKVHELAGSKGVTITEYLAALYLHCLSRLHDGSRRSILRLEVPVDMRRYYPSETVRNFSLYLSPEIDLKAGEWTFEEILVEMHHRMGLLKSRKQLESQLHRNVGAELNPLVRFLPLHAKDLFLNMVYSLLGEGLHSGVLSNLGRIELPNAMAEHVADLYVHVVPNQVMKKSCAVVSYGGFLNVSFAGVTMETELERLFFSALAGSGVEVTVKERR